MARPRALGRFGQASRQYHEAQPKGRKDRLREGTDIDCAPGGVIALHRGHRPSGKAILAVEIILEDPGVVLARDVDELEALLHPHRHPERALAGRSDVDQADGFVRRPEVPARWPDPQRNQLGAGRDEAALGARVARLLVGATKRSRRRLPLSSTPPSPPKRAGRC
jgi:hypothetical protein